MVYFYMNNRPNRVNAYWLTYYPGTKIIPIALEKGQITEEEIEQLYENPTLKACQVNRPPGRKDLHKLHSFILFSLFLPKSLFPFVKRFRLYRFIPNINALLIVGMVYRTRSVRKYAHMEKRVVSKYLSFSLRRLFGS